MINAMAGGTPAPPTIPVPSAQCLVPLEDLHLFRFAADLLRPRQRVLPSAWAEANVRLGAQATAQAGAFKAGYLPWLHAMLDRVHQRPGCVGEIWMCPAQVAKTTCMIVKLFSEIDTLPGDVLYLLESDDKCREIAAEKISPMLDDAKGGALRRQSEKAKDEGRRGTMLHVVMPQSRLVIASAGSESATTSGSYRVVVIDEFEMSADALMNRKGGDIWTSAKNRIKRWTMRGRISAFGHPRLADQGLALKFDELSDQGCWMFNCPHCDRAVFPRWRSVRYRALRDDGKPDPASAWLACPHCGEEITDAQRKLAVWPKDGQPGGRPGGSGRVESLLAPEEAARREFAGLWITALCDPNWSVAALAKDKLDAEITAERGEQPEAIADWWNKTQGEPMQAVGRSDIPDEAFASCRIDMDSPAIPSDIEVVTVGVDLGAPIEMPTLYVSAIGWGVNGTHYLLDAFNIRGVGNWAAYHHYLAQARWRTLDDRILGVAADCVDPNYSPAQAMDQARERVYSAAGSAVRRMVARFDASMKADLALRMAPEAKRYKPGSEHLGQLEYHYAHRHTWVDRLLRTFIDKRLKVALAPGVELPRGWREHMSANVLMPVKDKTGWETGRVEWQRVAHNVFDDWMTSATYALIAAVVGGNLDRLHVRRAAREADRAGSGRGSGSTGHGGVGFQVPVFE